MAVSKSQLQKTIKKITSDVEKAYAGLSLFFILHNKGGMPDAFNVAEHDVAEHRAGHATKIILQNHNKDDQMSGFLGLAIGVEKKFLGLKKYDHVLGV